MGLAAEKNLNTSSYEFDKKGFKKSLKQMKLIRQGKLPKKSYKQMLKEMDKE